MTTATLTDPPRSFAHHLDPVGMARTLWRHRELTWQFAARRVRGRYKGQVLGVAWSVLDPLVTLAIYTFVFGVIFGARRMVSGAEAPIPIGEFALRLYAGILVFNLFRETVGSAPTLVVSQPNLVKKVVYPLETLPVSQLLAAGFSLAVGLVVWLAGFAALDPQRVPDARILLLPVVVLPIALLALGLSWILASLGVFLRDLRNPVQSVLHMLFFLTPIFYRLEDVPEPYRSVIAINPLAQLVESARAVMMGTGWPAWGPWAGSLALGAALCLLGYAFFAKSRRAFADVI